MWCYDSDCKAFGYNWIWSEPRHTFKHINTPVAVAGCCTGTLRSSLVNSPGVLRIAAFYTHSIPVKSVQVPPSDGIKSTVMTCNVLPWGTIVFRDQCCLLLPETVNKFARDQNFASILSKHLTLAKSGKAEKAAYPVIVTVINSPFEVMVEASYSILQNQWQCLLTKLVPHTPFF